MREVHAQIFSQLQNCAFCCLHKPENSKLNVCVNNRQRVEISSCRFLFTLCGGICWHINLHFIGKDFPQSLFKKLLDLLRSYLHQSVIFSNLILKRALKRFKEKSEQKEKEENHVLKRKRSIYFKRININRLSTF